MFGRVRRIRQKIAYRLVEPIDRWAYSQFNLFPFGDSPRADTGTYMRIWNKARNEEYPEVSLFEKQMGYSVDREWFHDLALLTPVVVKKSEICYQHGRLLYSVLSAYIAQNNDESLNILETGTARGFSSLCMAKALNDARKPGKIVTFDVIPHDVEMYWNCIADEKGPMSRSDLLADYEALLEEYIIFVQGDTKHQLRKVSIPRIHLAFLDGAHTYDDVINEFCCLKDKQIKGDIVFFDDYTPRYFPGIVKAVDEICEKYGYSKEIITVSEQRGYVVTRKN